MVDPNFKAGLYAYQPHADFDIPLEMRHSREEFITDVFRKHMVWNKGKGAVKFHPYDLYRLCFDYQIPKGD